MDEVNGAPAPGSADWWREVAQGLAAEVAALRAPAPQAPVDVGRCIEELDRLIKSARRGTWCHPNCEPRCGYCLDSDWIEDATGMLQHAIAVLRSYALRSREGHAEAQGPLIDYVPSPEDLHCHVTEPDPDQFAQGTPPASADLLTRLAQMAEVYRYVEPDDENGRETFACLIGALAALRAPAPQAPICGAGKPVSDAGVAECQREPQHDGPHVSGGVAWEAAQQAPD